MTILILGLLLFLGVHSARVIAEPTRTKLVARLGENGWKGAYSLASAVGLGLIVWGFSMARQQPVLVWQPPAGMRHLAALLTLVAFVLLAAAYVPGNWVKAKLHHPMVLAVKVWALAHLLANGNLAHVLLFGGFLLWSVLSFKAARARDRAGQVVYPPGTLAATAATAVVGIIAWAGMAFWAHGALIGVRPLG